MEGLILLLIHLIGAMIVLIYDVLTGRFKEAVENRNDCDPSEIFFVDLVLWEIMLPFAFLGWCDETINKIFKKKYSTDEK